MNIYIVTVKLPKNPEHNIFNKKSGECPINGNYCTDITGAHHSFIIYSYLPVDQVKAEFIDKYGHVTRIERVTP